jgi:hypothetical protein
MNLVPYEYVVCRQGPEAAAAARQSMLVVSGEATANLPHSPFSVHVEPNYTYCLVLKVFQQSI